MPNVAELIKDHVTLSVDCVDRLYLNAYVPRLQTPGGVVNFLLHRGARVPSPALLGQTDGFKHALHTWCDDRSIPWVEFPRGARKDDLVEPYRKAFTHSEGVVLVGVAQERTTAWRAHKQTTGDFFHFDFTRTTVFVNHYYIYFIDPEWGPGFLKVCSYAPYAIKLCLNGHEWAKRQLVRDRVAFTPLDNGFLDCDDPTRLQATCDRLDAADVEACFSRWFQFVPLPLTHQDADAGYAYRLSIIQMEVSRTQVFDRPLRGREFFEEVIRENLDLGRPSHVQLLFERRITRRTPGRFQSRIITHGVIPSLHIEYKRCHVKQYFKEGRALRTETTFNDTYDVGVQRGLRNFAILRARGQQINTRLLEIERVAHDCALAEPALTDLIRPGRTETGQPAPALHFGDPRAMALLQALCLFVTAPATITNRGLRPLVAQLLGLPPEAYTARQMGYDLRRLLRKGLLTRTGRQLTYTVTPAGRRLTLFVSRVYSRILRPGTQALATPQPSSTPPPLFRAFRQLDRVLSTYLQEAHLTPSQL